MQGTIELTDKYTQIMGCYDDEGRLFFVGPRLEAGSRVPVGAALVRCELYSEHKVRVDWEKKVYRHYRFSICKATEQGIEEVVAGIDFPKKCQRAALALFEEFVAARRAELLAAVPGWLRGCYAEGIDIISSDPRSALRRVGDAPLFWEELAVASLPVVDKEQFLATTKFLRLLRFPFNENQKPVALEAARAEIENILLFEAIRGGSASEKLSDSLWRAFSVIAEEAGAELR